MTKLLLAGAIVLIATAAQAQYGFGTGGTGTGSNPNSHPVRGYTSGGTYVPPRQQTNGTQRDNYSAYGNVNPYTGAVGTRTPKN